jgi:hypothetical protein
MLRNMHVWPLGPIVTKERRCETNSEESPFTRQLPRPVGPQGMAWLMAPDMTPVEVTRTGRGHGPPRGSSPASPPRFVAGMMGVLDEACRAHGEGPA